jgi:hypothetical protein
MTGDPETTSVTCGEQQSPTRFQAGLILCSRQTVAIAPIDFRVRSHHPKWVIDLSRSLHYCGTRLARYSANDLCSNALMLFLYRRTANDARRSTTQSALTGLQLR